MEACIATESQQQQHIDQAAKSEPQNNENLRETDKNALNVVIEKLSEICSRPSTDVLSLTAPVLLQSGLVLENQFSTDSNTSSSLNSEPNVNFIFESQNSQSQDEDWVVELQEATVITNNESSEETQAVYFCDECNYSSHNKYYLKQHLDLVHNSKRPYKCPFCDYAGKRSYALKEHLIVHSNDRPHECVHCHATFRKKGHLTNHIKMHANQLVCSICKVVCKGKEQLLNHLHQQHSSAGTKVYACDQCLYATLNNADMIQHVEAHFQHGVTAPPSAEFQNSSSQANSADDTVNKSTPVMQMILKCSECGATSTSKKLMQKHMLDLHIKPKPKPLVEKVHSCSYCGFNCTDESTLLKHKLNHSRTRPLSIQPAPQGLVPVAESGGKFSYDPRLRQFACSICSYTCDQQRTIKSHIWKHSGHKDILYPMFPNASSAADDSSTTVTSGSEIPQTTSKPVTSGSDIAPEEPDTSATETVTSTKTAVETTKETESHESNVVVQANKAELGPEEVQKSMRIRIGDEVVSVQLVQKNEDDSTSEQSPQKKHAITPNTTVQPISPKKVEVRYIESEAPPVDIVVGDTKCAHENLSVSVEPKNGTENSTVRNTEKETEVVTVNSRQATENADDNKVSALIRKRRASDSVVEKTKRTRISAPSTAVSADTTNTNMTTGVVGAVLRKVSSRQVRETSKNVVETESDKNKDGGAKSSDQDVGGKQTIDNVDNDVDIMNVDEESENRSPVPVQAERSIQTRSSKRKSGICSSLLAVIEQLRERSGNEETDDAEVESDGPKVVVRPVQKRGRPKTIAAETKEPDSEPWSDQNVEQLPTSMYRCKLCHYQSFSISYIKQHMRRHKSKQPFECSLCDFIAPNSEVLQDHMLRHCKVRTYQCKTCSAAFNYKSQLRAHQRAHNETEPFACTVCHFETRNPINFRNHIRIHAEYVSSGINGQTCRTCRFYSGRAPFTTECEKAGHKKDGESDVTGQASAYVCDECDFSASDHTVLNEHIKNAHDGTTTTAETTVEDSNSKSTDDQSAATNESTNQMQCNLCEFTAISVRSLKSHMKRHVNDQRYVEQPLEQYKCTLCGYVCHHLPSLKSHMWRHASEKKYSYQQANDVINAAIDRAAMTKTDADTFITFRCCQCGYESNDRANLNRHMKQHQDVIARTLVV